MVKYKIRIDTEALDDILHASEWYHNQSNGLDIRFQKQIKTQINLL